jgi:hypothetical protein
MNPIQFTTLNLPISNIYVKSIDNEFLMKNIDNKYWVLNYEEANNVIDEYQIIINQRIIIPDISRKYIIREQNISSICAQTDKALENIQIVDLFCCEHIGLDNETGRFFPIQRTDKFNNSNELINIWCEFESVKCDFVILLEIFSKNTIFDIIPVVINASSKERNYKKTFYCSFSNMHFRESEYWNIRVRVSDTNYQETRIKFNFIKAQAYNSNLKNG